MISGTGSIAFGKNAQGRTARAGGWGYLFGDEGGGFWIVREAMRAALRWEEGWGSPTALRAILLDATGARNMNDLMHRCYTPEFPRPRVAGLSFQVNTAAESGDPVALRILEDAARELGLLASAIRAQLFEAGETVQMRLRRRSFPQPHLVSGLPGSAQRRIRSSTHRANPRACGRCVIGGLSGSGGRSYQVRQPFLVRRLG